MLSPLNETDSGARRAPGRKTVPLLLLPSLTVILLLFGGGLVLGILQALGWWSATSSSGLTLIHFTAVFRDPDFLGSLGITLYISLTSTLIAGTISVFLALSLARFAAGSRFITFLLQIPLTVPHLVIAVSVTMLLSPAGLFSRLGSLLGFFSGSPDFPLLVNDPYSIGILLSYVWKEIPFITFMLLAVLKNAGTELHDVGRTLKAGPWQRFRRITLPLIAPNLAAGCLIVFAFTFGAFEVPYLLGKTYPTVLPVWAYKNYADIDLLARPEGIAIGLIIAVVVTCCVLLSQALVYLTRRQDTPV